MNKRSKLGTVLILIGIVGLTYVIATGGKSPLEGMTSFFTTEVNERQTVDAAAITNLSVKSDSIDVHIVRVNGGTEASATLEGSATKALLKHLKLTAEPKGDTLEVALEGKRGFGVGFGWSRIKLTIELPDKTYNRIEVNVDSGDITAEGLTFNEAAWHADSGDIAASGLTSLSSLKATANSGDLHFEQVEAKTVELGADSGDITVKDYKAEGINFEASSGDVALFDGLSQLKGSVRSGDIHLQADNLKHDTELKTTSGDVIVELVETPSSLAVHFDAGSGEGVIQKDGFVYTGGEANTDNFTGTFGAGEIKLKVSVGSGDFVLK
ncbi:DUF4097 family beta strand repeat-containing protein [Paenibacillus sp. GCM10027627]|uniref:DUF4097 family beta strand repeat-containing protein n=1 Tax=unclassified Paenibacillus TaxID=185978 RepID=UPI00362AB089